MTEKKCYVIVTGDPSGYWVQEVHVYLPAAEDRLNSHFAKEYPVIESSTRRNKGMVTYQNGDQLLFDDDYVEIMDFPFYDFPWKDSTND